MIPLTGPQQTCQRDAPPESAQSPAFEQAPSQSLWSPAKKSVMIEIHPEEQIRNPESLSRIQVQKSLTPVKTSGAPNSPLSLSKFSKTKYLTGLGLMPIQKARRVSERRRSTKCENIDLDEDAMPSPTKPRTPKLLISHLSRDESSTSAEHNKSCMRSLFPSHSSMTDEDGATDSKKEISDSKETESDDSEKTRDRLRNVKSLFNIAISSPLGQCVMKHYKGDPSFHILSDIESHCLTELTKNKEQGCRLRVRHPTYPVIFRGPFRTKGSFYCHKYNFNKEDKKEFLRRVATGLDRESRALCRKLKKCKVHLTRLTKADLKLWMPSQNHITVDLKPLTPQEIKYWMLPKPLFISTPNQPAVFPSGLSLSSPNLNKVLGLRTRDDKNQSPEPLYPHLSVTNFVSEEVSAEVTENRRTVLNSILSDFIAKGEISKDLFPTNTATPSRNCGTGNYATLRNLLSRSGVGKLRTLPDITNLGPAARCKALKINMDQLDLENQPNNKTFVEKPTHKEVNIEDNFLKIQTINKRCEIPQSNSIRFSSRLSQTKSTYVRLAQEGDEIIGCKLEPSHSSTVDSETEVFPCGLSSLSSLKRLNSSSSNSSESKLDGSCDGSEVRKLRKRQRKTTATMQLRASPLKAPSSCNETAEDENVMVVKDNSLWKRDIPLIQSTPVAGGSFSYPSNTNKSSSNLESSPGDHSVALPEAKPSLHDLKFSKRLLSASLVWCRSHSSDSKRDQENESDERTVFHLDKGRITHHNHVATKVSANEPKRQRYPRTASHSKRSYNTISNKGRKRTSINPDLSTGKYQRRKRKSRSVDLHKNACSLKHKPCSFSQTQVAYHDEGDKYRCIVTSSPGKRSPGKKHLYTTIKSKVDSKKTPMLLEFL